MVAPPAMRHLLDSVQQLLVTSVSEEHAAPVLKMETVRSSKMLVTMYQTIQCHKIEVTIYIFTALNMSNLM